MEVKFPPIYSINETVSENSVRKICKKSYSLKGRFVPFAKGSLRGFQFVPDSGGDSILVLPRKRVLSEFSKIIQAEIDPSGEYVDLSEFTWIKHPLLTLRSQIRYTEEIEKIQTSWEGQFLFSLEDPPNGKVGLRSPQLGALHAVHAHWLVSNLPATIIMPTGTGKTDTMIAILVSCQCEKILIIVPTDALRNQIVKKFLSLGIFKEDGASMMEEAADYPIVATLQHIPQSAQVVDDLFAKAQVIVSTSNIVGQSSDEVQLQIANLCTHLFIDEAHHAEAPTWSRFKGLFTSSKILQFTATPFREDGKPLDGKIIFNFPLKLAQEQGYFKAIRFKPVVEFDAKKIDKVIAEKAIEQLREDFHKGHILMARVGTVARAKEVFRLYENYVEFNPVQIHTGVSGKERAAIRKKIISGSARIIVCVDMLGEGFDLPQLKIAAFHDIRKTLAVTLQLAGRFTRVYEGLGDATFIANTAEVQVQDELRKLYSRDPDWNMLLPQLSSDAIGDQVSLQEFLRGFTAFAEEFPLRVVRPATSTVVYRVETDEWHPENFRAGIPSVDSCRQVHHSINEEKHVIIIVTARQVSLEWIDVENVYSWSWDLYVVFWSQKQNLLFINGSSNASTFAPLARAIINDAVRLIDGPTVFRTLSGVNRLKLQNVGLSEQIGRNVRYTGRMGADIEAAISERQRSRAQKVVVAGNGFEGGERVSVGASRKGRIWTYRRGHIHSLIDWCKSIGEKLLDEDIDPDELLKGTLESIRVSERPNKMPIMIDWPEEVYSDPESRWFISINGVSAPLYEFSISLLQPSIDGDIRFSIESEEMRTELALEIFRDGDDSDYRFVLVGQAAVGLSRGEQAEVFPIVEYFDENPPKVWFLDGSSLEGNEYIELKSEYLPYERAKILAWDWTGVDIRKESQGIERVQDSIQAKVVQELKRGSYSVIIDDDGKGEAADIVTISLKDDDGPSPSIEVEFYHCKYSQSDTPGARIEDLYEVCGQAQKSISWLYSVGKKVDLFTHLLRRSELRREQRGVDRFELGDLDLLAKIRDVSYMCSPSFKIFIVQPGVSKSVASFDQLQILSVTENYLKETYQVDLSVVTSS